jgi:hypothetical protein
VQFNPPDVRDVELFSWARHRLGQDGYDVCFALRLRVAPAGLLPEYEETALVSARDAEAWLDATGRAVVPTSRVILELARAAALW